MSFDSTVTIDPPIQLQPWAKEVARLMSIGYSPSQISIQTGVTLPELISLMKNSDFKILAKEVNQEISDSTINVRLRLEMAAQGALDTIIDLMYGSRSDIVKRLCANDVLDRAGHSVIQKHEAVHTVIIDDKRADLIIQTSREIQAPLEMEVSCQT